MLQLSPFEHADECFGYQWSVTDISALARLVAHLVVGQYRYVERILHELDAAPVQPATVSLRAKVAYLRAPPDPDQRDGWVFQFLSWITAHQSGVPFGAISPPHLQPAFKGFDSLALRFDSTGLVVGTIVTEDKATKNARKTITDKVWPGITELENGQRDDQLQHTATSVLERYFGDGAAIEAAIGSVFWLAGTRCYRVCMGSHGFLDNEDGRRALFAGYLKRAPGDLWRRRAETFRPEDIRVWMAAFAHIVADALEGMVPADV